MVIILLVIIGLLKGVRFQREVIIDFDLQKPLPSQIECDL
jgi:hypothetical protein